MAVPKKKVSHSRTRKRLLSKKLNFNKYVQCIECLNFIPTHAKCSICSLQKAYIKGTRYKGVTNINELYSLDI
jgi:ribosomal protein L32|uniref:Ribosomal protein L32 n=1 Tax=Telonemida sp. TaxID=2652706 RepID=A0A5P8DJW7_9EUKA|nr:ribosomal protein L32 [Telonemida sp.]